MRSTEYLYDASGRPAGRVEYDRPSTALERTVRVAILLFMIAVTLFVTFPGPFIAFWKKKRDRWLIAWWNVLMTIAAVLILVFGFATGPAMNPILTPEQVQHYQHQVGDPNEEVSDGAIRELQQYESWKREWESSMADHLEWFVLPSLFIVAATWLGLLVWALVSPGQDETDALDVYGDPESYDDWNERQDHVRLDLDL